jgi:thermitase
VVHSQAWTNDPFLLNGTLWGLVKVKAPTAWNVTRGDGAVVAVIDSGITADNPDLTNNLWQNPNEVDDGIDNDNNGFVDDHFGADWVRMDGMPDDEEGHGTHVAGTIAATANDGNPMVGVAPSAHIMALKFLDGTGSGNVGDAISAIDYAVKNGASVINASWGGPDYSAALQDAIKRAGDAGVVFVAAAGNDSANNDTTPTYPAAYNLPNELSVAATDAQGQLASFSNYGTGTVDVAAPGVDIYSTVGDHYESWSGTSMATPFVSGVAALLKSVEPGAGAAQIADAIRVGAHPLQSLTGKVKTGGEVDAVGALAAIGHSPLSANDPAPGVFRLKKPGTRVYTGGGSKVGFSWSHASDSDLVGYEVYVDGKLKATVNDPDGSQGPLAAKTASKIKVSAGRHRWNVIAVDEAGNTRMAGRGRGKGRVAVLSRKH